MTEKNKAEQLSKLKEMFDECFTSIVEHHSIADESHNFYFGDPFTNPELRAMKAKGLTPMVYNIIQKNINMMIGLCEMNKNRAKVKPYEQDDTDLANILDMVLNWSMMKARAYEKTVMAYKDSLLGGLGFLCPYMDYDTDLLNGELKIAFIPYSNVFFDASVKEKDFSDVRYFILRNVFDKKIMMVRFPEFAEEIKALSDDYFSDSSVGEEVGLKGMVQVKEYWYKEIEKVYHVYAEETLVKYNKEEYEKNKEEILKIASEDDIIEMDSLVIKYAVVLNDSLIVYDGYSPYGDAYIPVVPWIGFCDMSAKKLKKKFFGLIESLKDVQRDKNRNKINRRYAQNATLHSGWFTTKGSIDDSRQLQLGMGMQIVQVNPGATDPRRIPLPNYPQYLFAEEDKNDQDRVTIGLNADALGIGATSNDSSKAVSLRQQTGITAVAEIPANYSIAMRLLAKICLDMIMRNITPKKVQRIVGNKYVVDDAVFASLIEREFDIMIDESTYNPTHKEQMRNQMVEYMQYSGQPVPFSTYLRYTETDPALRDEIIKDQQAQQEMMLAQQQGTVPGGSVPPGTDPATGQPVVQ